MTAAGEPGTVFPLTPPVELPEGFDETALRALLESVQVEGAPADELRTYCREDFWRFVRTFGLVRGLEGRCLELGANPYFTTTLLVEFTGLELVLANYFGLERPRSFWRRKRTVQQEVVRQDRTGRIIRPVLTSHHFNLEQERFPFGDEEFDVVLFCEIIEHLLNDPLAALLEIKRVLRPDGVLVLTTPNVNRLENVVRMVAGVNIYDSYSGYGPYGRHNREYNKHELHVLLTYAGFEVEALESADVHENRSDNYTNWAPLIPLLMHRKRDLGQYLFLRARNQAGGGTKRPDFLYRSYPSEELERA
jgi:SAM-dependent methyltransferase